MTDRPIKTWVARMALAVITLVTLGRLLLCDFTWWDDGVTIHGNPLMNPVQLDTFKYVWTNAPMDIYIPLTYTAWAIVALAARTTANADGMTLNPMLFHALNLLTHVVGAWGVFALLRRLLNHDVAALVSAALWAIHPVQVESVGWLSGYKDVLSGTLAIWSAERFVAWRQRGGDEKGGGAKVYAVSFLLFAAAMLAKPAAMTLPLVIAVIDLLAIRPGRRRTLTAVLPFVLGAVPIMALAKIVQPAPITYSPMWARPLLVTDTLAFYLCKIAFPLRTSLDYGRSPEHVIAWGAVWYTWLVPAAVAIAVAFAYRRAGRRGQPLGAIPLLAAAIFVLAPLHVLGLVPFDFQTFSTVADHYLYVALLGPALWVGWLVVRFSRRVLVAVVVLMLPLAARSMLITPVWDNEETVMSHTLSVNPDSWMAYLNLGAYYGRFGRMQAEGWALNRAADLNPDNPFVQMNLAIYSIESGRLAEIEPHMRRYLQQYINVFGRNERIVPAYLKIIDVFINDRFLDDADRFADEALEQFPADAALKVRKKHIGYLRSDPQIKALPSIKTATRPAAIPAATTRPTSGPAR